MSGQWTKINQDGVEIFQLTDTTVIKSATLTELQKRKAQLEEQLAQINIDLEAISEL